MKYVLLEQQKFWIVCSINITVTSWEEHWVLLGKSHAACVTRQIRIMLTLFFPLEEANNQKRGKLNNNKRKKGKKTKKIIPLDGYPLLMTPLRVFLTTV